MSEDSFKISQHSDSDSAYKEAIPKKKVQTQPISQPTTIPREMTAQSYYDQQEKHTITTREFSRLIQLRNFQNWVKAAMISEWGSNLKSNLPKSRNLLNVSEMGCGKGGDIGKWQRAGTGAWFGIDISGEGLKEAMKRQRESKGPMKIPKLYLMQASANMDSTLYRARLPQDLYFDVVSMQFMANLLFSSKIDVENMLENITSRLCNQGIVLMTITDASVLIKKMRTMGHVNKEGEHVYDRNQYFSLKFDTLEFPKGEPWGQKYYFYLEDAVGKKENGQIVYVPEYLIELQAFKDKALEYNLEIVEDMNFTEFHSKYSKKYKDLLIKMIKPPFDNWQMPKEQWEIVHLYRVLVMKHLKGQPQSKIRRHPNLTDLPDEHLELNE